MGSRLRLAACTHLARGLGPASVVTSELQPSSPSKIGGFLDLEKLTLCGEEGLIG